VAAERVGAGVRGEHPGAHRGRGVRHQRYRLVGVHQRVEVVLGQRDRLGHLGEQPGPRLRGGVRGQVGELLLQQRQRPGRTAGRDQCAGGLRAEQAEVDLEIGRDPGVADQLERGLVVVRGVVGAADRHRLVAGADAGVDGGAQVAGLQGVPGELGGGARAVRGEEGLDVGLVQADTLAGQQVVVHRLGEESVPERVGVAAARHQHVELDGLAQGLVERGSGDTGDVGEQGMGHPAARRRGGADDLLGVLVEAVEAHEQQFGEVVGQGLPGRDRCADQLLDEERVALGAGDDPGDVALPHRAWMQLVDQVADVARR
jgi:hypothetical protein